VAGTDLEIYGATVEVDYVAGLAARIDGTNAGAIAVEIESRTSKQVRRAVLDLLMHPYAKILFVLLPAHMSNPETAAEQCRFALKRYLRDSDFRVEVMKGHGSAPNVKEDAARLKVALPRPAYQNHSD
jgi:hypothetical protein